MATNNEKLQELSVEEKLQHLYELQRIDTEIDKIKTLRGELPLEVQDWKTKSPVWKPVLKI